VRTSNRLQHPLTNIKYNK